MWLRDEYKLGPVGEECIRERLSGAQRDMVITRMGFTLLHWSLGSFDLWWITKRMSPTRKSLRYIHFYCFISNLHCRCLFYASFCPLLSDMFGGNIRLFTSFIFLTAVFCRLRQIIWSSFTFYNLSNFCTFCPILDFSTGMLGGASIALSQILWFYCEAMTCIRSHLYCISAFHYS